MKGNQILKLILVFGGLFHNIICHIKSIPTNKETYVMVTLKCGNNDWRIPINVFILIQHCGIVTMRKMCSSCPMQLKSMQYNYITIVDKQVAIDMIFS
jgi:hypothetical protein